MDLGAYVQIEDLGELAKLNGIYVPRLRGYRLMKDEKPLTKEEWREIQEDVELRVLEMLCESEWGQSRYYCWSVRTIAKCAKHIKNYEYLYKSEDEEGYKKPEIRWDKIKGKKKRIFITRVKNEMRGIKKQYAVWNKYCGREDILYIHARIGGGNWAYYGTDVKDQPWLIERVDDGYDCTYCDIYAKLSVIPEKCSKSEV